MRSERDPDRITVRKATSAAAAERLDREFWAALTPAQRVLLASQLSEELWSWKEPHPHESGLPRSAARLERR
jgi:hypothetical protein